jgi:hypothetical protein
VRRLVFVCALLPEIGLSLRDKEGVFVQGFGEALVRDELDRSYWPEGKAEQGLYPVACPQRPREPRHGCAASRIPRPSR